MPATVHLADLVLDGALDAVKNNCDTIHACAMGENANTYNNCAVNYSLGSVSVAGTDFVHADRAVSGRKTTFQGKTISISTSGTVDALAFVDAVGTTLYVVALPSSNIGVTGGVTSLIIDPFDLVGFPDAVAV